MIFKDINKLGEYIIQPGIRIYKCETIDFQRPVIVTSGYFDPLHIGHVRCIRDSIRGYHFPNHDPILIVIVNSDEAAVRKKGKPFMPLDERMEIVDSLKGVDFVTTWEDGSPTVVGALEILKPDIFTKGGDRGEGNVPEADICDKIGCKIIYGVGGGKIQSSSLLIKNSM